jgi:hypothetical protein
MAVRPIPSSGRYPAIVVTPMQIRATSFALDGEGVVCRGMGSQSSTTFTGTGFSARLYEFDPL